jgi:hypothetical protein
MQKNLLKINKYKNILNIKTFKKEHSFIKRDYKLIESNNLKAIRSANPKSYFSGNSLEVKKFG